MVALIVENHEYVFCGEPSGLKQRYSYQVMYVFAVEAARRGGNWKAVRWDLKVLYCWVETEMVNLQLGLNIASEPKDPAVAGTPNRLE